MTNERVLIVVPTYDEAGNVPTLVSKLETAREEQPFDLLFVDDGSPDGTADVIRDLSATRPWIHLMSRPGRGGLGSAYRDAFVWGLRRGHTRLIEMDADLSHDPAVIPELLAAVDAGAALAIGSRYVLGGGSEGWPMRRRALSRGANLFARSVLGVSVRDVTSGFRMYDDRAARLVIDRGTECQGYGFQVEGVAVVAREELSIREVPITFRDRTVGRSKMSLATALEAAKRCVVLGARPHEDARPSATVAAPGEG